MPALAVLPVVVVHHRAPDWCRASVASLRASVDVDVDVLVVDNSGDLGALPEPSARAVVLRPDHNLGYAGGANLGLEEQLRRQPGARAIAICAHDAHVEPVTLARLCDLLEQDPSLGIVAPRFGEPRDSVGGRWTGEAAENLLPSAGDPDVLASDWLCGTCLVVRVDCLRSIGGFDDRFGSYVEDVDLCLRARDQGWEVATLTTVTAHGLGSSSSDKHRLMLRNAVYLVAKREGAAAARRLLRGYLATAARQVVGCVVRPERRARLRRAARHVGVVVEVGRHGLLRRLAAAPDEGVPSFALAEEAR